MHLLKKDVGPALRAALWGIGIWCAVDSILHLQSILWVRERSLPIPWGRYVANYGESVLLGLATPLILWVSRRWPFGRGIWGRAASAHLLTAVAIHVVFHPTSQLLRFDLAVLFDDSGIYRQGGLTLLLVRSLGTLVAYAQMALACHGLLYYQRWRERETRAARLEAQLAQAQLEMLRMQLHPHFLFNTLHSVSSLMHSDVKAADRMLALLGDLLRDSLDKVGTQEVTLKQELDFIDRYLEIERARFRDRLTITVSVDPDAWDVPVPTFVLQPLVENAIRHGISRRAGAGSLAISAERENGRLVLSVRDDGAGLPGEGILMGRGGLGIANTEARLRQLYGALGRLELRSRTSGGVEARVEIPLRASAPEAGSDAILDSPASTRIPIPAGSAVNR